MELLDPIQHPHWDHLVQAHGLCSIFHSAAWAKVLTSTYQHRPLYLCYSQGREPLALLPLMEVQSRWTGIRGVSLPFTDSCVPLVFQNELWEQIIEDLKFLCKTREWRHFELRGTTPAKTKAYEHTAYLEHHLPLDKAPAQVFSNFSDATRRAIRKALKSNIRLEISQDEAALKAYYFLHCKTRKRHGIPPQPLSFFESVGREIIARGHGFIAIAYRSAIPISGALFFHFGQKAVYKFGASDPDYQECRPNNLVMWSAIQRLMDMGMESLHWGRTSEANPGLRRFKLGWGTNESTLGYLRWQQRKATWVRARDRATGFHNMVFRNLPLRCNALLGTLLYPHLD